MKKFKTTLILTISFLFSINLFAEEKLYVFFDDIDNVYDTGYQHIIQDGVKNLYFDPLLMNNYFTPNLLKTGYANFFNSGKNLLDFEVAIFWVGNRPLQYDASTGHKIVREIKTMLDNGKRVIILGNALLAAAFAPNSQFKDPEVTKFLQDYLGITPQSYITMNTTEGSHYKPFGVKAVQGDPVTLGYKKVCNAIHGPDIGELLPPWRFTEWMDVVDMTKLDSTAFGTKAVMTEFLTWTWNWFDLDVTPQTNYAVGLRVQGPSKDPVQDYKVVMWTSGFEMACATQSMPDWQKELWFALKWCVDDLPKPGPNISFSVDPLDFGTVPISESKVEAFTIKNIGRETLEIYDIYTEGFASEGIFEIVTEDLTFNLEPGETKIIEVKFTPSEEMFYSEYLDVESNAANGTLQGIELNGWGGKKPEPGPKLAVASNILDFGTIKPGEKDTLDIKLTNTGTGPLYIMEKFYWPNELKPPFMYAHPYEWSIIIEPGDTVVRSIKFAPSGMTGTFYDTIGIVPYNAVNYKNDTLWVYLKGVSSMTSGDASINLTTNYIEIDSVELGKTNKAPFEIENTGKIVLKISKLEMEDDFDGVFKLLDDDEEDFQHRLPLGLYLSGPSKKRLFYIEFEPKEPKIYQGKIIIEITDNEDNPIPELNQEISVVAIGKDTTTVGVQEKFIYPNLILTATPNPASNYVKLNFSTYSDTNLSIYIMDALGNTVKTIRKGKIEAGSYVENLDISNFASGNYSIVATISGETLRIPLIIIK